MDTCQIEACDSPVFVESRGWCKKHYNRWYRSGDPMVVKQVHVVGLSAIDRWWAKVDKTDACWLWTGSLDRRGYGQFDVWDESGHKNHRAHRWGYQKLIRVLADDEVLDHLCRVRQCVNPAHLEPVTNMENLARGHLGAHNAVKTHCPQGHEYNPDNTIPIGPDGRWRACRACARVAARESNRRRRGTPPDALHNRDKTHCKRGHEFTPENTIRTSAGNRQCRECTRRLAREAYARKKAEGP